MIEEFKKFAMKGNVVDLAVAVIIGGAFGRIVTSFVNDIIMPPIGMLIGGVDFSELVVTIKEATDTTEAITINYGLFVNTVLNFLIVAVSIFLVVKGLSKMKRKTSPPEPTEKDCEFCFSRISIKATRCPHCTSEFSQGTS